MYKFIWHAIDHAIHLAFPYGDDLPAEFAQGAGVFFVVGDVGGEFILPEGDIGGRRGGVFAAFMPVPEAAVNKDDRSVFRKNNVRFAGERFDVFPEAVSRAVQHGAENDFRPGVPVTDSRHVPASLFFGEMIHVCF